VDVVLGSGNDLRPIGPSRESPTGQIPSIRSPTDAPQTGHPLDHVLVANQGGIHQHVLRKMKRIVTDDCKRTNDDLQVSAPSGAMGEASHVCQKSLVCRRLGP
jgi:hypothetical protein